MNERDNHNYLMNGKAFDKCHINFTIFKNLKLRIEEKQTSFICKKVSAKYLKILYLILKCCKFSFEFRKLKYLASYFVYLEEWN